MTEKIQCESCTMTIESGAYCQYCSDDNGGLIAFSEALERFMQFTMQRDQSLTKEAARAQTLEFMSKQPAWANHSELPAGGAEPGSPPPPSS